MKAFERHSFADVSTIEALKLIAPALKSLEPDVLLVFLERYFSSRGQDVLADLARRLKPLSSEQKKILASALTDFQLDSKNWLVEEMRRIKPCPQTVFVLGGWMGVLPFLLLNSDVFPEARIFSFDRDEKCAVVAETLCRPWVMQDWRFKASTADIFQMNFEDTRFQTKRRDGSDLALSKTPDLIINTICEHLADLPAWLELVPRGLPLVLQSNNMFDEPDHLNCVRSLQEFVAQIQPFDVHWAGQLESDGRKRFLVMGVRA